MVFCCMGTNFNFLLFETNFPANQNAFSAVWERILIFCCLRLLLFEQSPILSLLHHSFNAIVVTLIYILSSLFYSTYLVVLFQFWDTKHSAPPTRPTHLSQLWRRLRATHSAKLSVFTSLYHILVSFLSKYLHYTTLKLELLCR